MALFPRCNNPVSVVGRHGLTLVGCHSCIQCRVAAQEHLCKILEVEASKHKYVEFITNTYDDLHLPYIDTSFMYPFCYFSTFINISIIFRFPLSVLSLL